MTAERSARRRLWATCLLAASATLSACVGATHVEVTATSASDSKDSAAASPSTSALSIPSCVASLSDDQKAAEMLMVLVEHPGAATPLLVERLVGGFGLVGKQAAEVADQVTLVKAAAPFPIFVASDEEGGTVQRLNAWLGDLPAARDVANTMSVGDATLLYRSYMTKMHDGGFNMNFGPVIDVGSGSELGTRTFGDDANIVVNYGLGAMQATVDAGLIPVVKHWPGLGSGSADPHKAAVPLGTFEQLQEKDLIPFDRAIALNAPAIMVSHASISGTTEGLPASLSRPAITGLLRGTQGYNGLVITDSLGMSAVTMHVHESQAASMALAAGADIALVSDPEVARQAHVAVVGAIQSGQIPAAQVDASLARILTAKGVTGDCPVKD